MVQVVILHSKVSAFEQRLGFFFIIQATCLQQADIPSRIHQVPGQRDTCGARTYDAHLRLQRQVIGRILEID